MGLDLAGLDEGGESGKAVFVVNAEGHGILVEELEDGWDRICRAGVNDNFGGHFWGGAVGVVSGEVGGGQFLICFVAARLSYFV